MKFKNILLYAALLSGMSFSSCTDFLDEDSNPNALSPGIFWKSEGDIMKGLTSVYGALQPNASWAIPFERYIVIDGYRSDEITHRDDVTSWMNISSFNVEPTNSVVKTEWTNLYKGINYANQCLTNIPTVPGDSESLNALKKQSIAEARFLRAYFYYRLYVNFGERVPIYKEALAGTDEEFYPPQANPGELVSLIETELKEVQSDLPESYEESEKGRVTRYTAAALLGKFYMFRKELGKAEVEFKKIIDKEGSLGLIILTVCTRTIKSLFLRFSLPETVQADSMNITCLLFIWDLWLGWMHMKKLILRIGCVRRYWLIRL